MRRRLGARKGKVVGVSGRGVVHDFGGNLDRAAPLVSDPEVGTPTPRGMFAGVNIGGRVYWRFIVAPGGAGDAASG